MRFINFDYLVHKRELLVKIKLEMLKFTMEKLKF